MRKSAGISRFVPLLAGLLLLSYSAVMGQSAGKIAGRVTDGESGEPLPSANIVLADTELGTISDEKGRFFILNVPPGVYTVRVTYVGYGPLSVEEVGVSAGLTTDLDLKPMPEAIQAEEMVIRAERPIIDKNATNAVRIISAEDLEILPFRGVQNVFAMQTGVVEDEGVLHVRGSRADEIGYYVEGANTRNIVQGNNAVGIIDEALAEVQLQAGGFNAEFGGANAGIIIHQLRTGAPEWEFGFLAETDNFTNENEERFGTYSYGYSTQVLTASGPLFNNQKIRAFIAGQRSVEGSDPVYWEGFEVDELIDTGTRGQAHWRAQDVPDTATVTVPGGNVPHTGNESFDLNGTLLLDFSPIQFRISGLYGTSEFEINPQPIRNIFNQQRLPEGENSAGLLRVKATHVLNPSTFYDVSLSFYSQTRESYDPQFKDNFWVYNDSFAVANTYGSMSDILGTESIFGADRAVYASTGTRPEAMDLVGFPFYYPGTPTSESSGSNRTMWYNNRKQGYWGVGSSLTKQSNVHLFKAGFDYERWTHRRYAVALRSIRSAIKNSYPELDAVYDEYYAGTIGVDDIGDALVAKAETLAKGQGSLEDLKKLIRLNGAGGDMIGYDEFGNESDRSDNELEAPRHPVVASAYLQDKIEYNDLVVNAGVRLDYFDVDSWQFVDPGAPVRDSDLYTLVVKDADGTYMKKTDTYTEISPRLGFSFPVSERTVFHVQYGRFSQMPKLSDMFTGGGRLSLELGGQNFIPLPSAFDIEPIRTTQYEIGFERQFTDFASFDITGFYRDVKGQVQLRQQKLGVNAQDVAPYLFLQNGDFATTKGLEFQMKMRRINRIQAELNYTLADARGTGSNQVAALSAVENTNDPPSVVMPLDFNEKHRGSIYVDYRFGKNEGNPIVEQLGANLLLRFTSGHSFTLSDGGIGQRGPEEGAILSDDDPRHRKPSESVNMSTTPWTYEFDLRVDKGFDLFGADAQAYFYIRNLFNRQNVINVYWRTGNDSDDGFLTDDELSSKIVEANGGLQYRELYEFVNLANRQHYWFAQGGDIYGEPRQLRFGIRFGI